MIDPLFVDTYILDRSAPIEIADVKQLLDAGSPWCGFVHKMSQGTYENEVDRINMFRGLILQHERYTVDFFEGFYHFDDFSQDPVDQANYFWSNMSKIGGERAGTLWAMIDVERGGQRYVPTSAQELIDHVSEWAARYHALSGRLPTLYGGELLRSLGVHKQGGPIEMMGCGRNSIALYGPSLMVDVMTATGTDPDHLGWWQYDGDGEAYLKDYPREAPGFGKIDISVLTMRGGLTAMKAAL